MKFQRTHFRTGFTHEKNTFSVGRWWVQKIFFFCFSCGKPSVGTKKKRPGYPKKNISSLIQTWKQKLIYKTFHLVSQFVFHVWDRIYKTTLLHVWKTKWKKSLCKRKPFLENLISFSVSNMKKKLWNVFPLAFSVPFFFVWKRIKEMRNDSFLHAWNGKRLGRRHVFFFYFQTKQKHSTYEKKSTWKKSVGKKHIFFLKITRK